MSRDVIAQADGCFDAQRPAAADPSRVQRDGSLGRPPGRSRRAEHGGAPQGTRNFEERSDRKVYGATPSTTAKETTTLPKAHRGGWLLCGSRSPSGEPPEAQRGAASKTGHHAGRAERRAA